MIHWSLSSILSSVKHIPQNAYRMAQYYKCKQLFSSEEREEDIHV